MKPETDFEKLLWALGYVRYLKKKVKRIEFEAGVLRSERDELKYINGVERITELEKQLSNALKTIEAQKVQNIQRKTQKRQTARNQAEIIRKLQLENDNLRLNLSEVKKINRID